eukprot:gene7497-8087_t
MESEKLSSKAHEWYLPQPFCDSSDALERLYPLKVFSTLTKSKVRFIPQHKDFVTWYQCGPTVYAESHLGHARTYVSLDIIKRIMRDFFNYQIVLCQNITDIDDKIIIRSNENGEDFRALASRYEVEFLDDMKSLGVELPDVMTRVSEYVKEIIEFIAVIEKKGFAYESEGSVYFDVDKFTAAGYAYGKLSPEQIGNSKLQAEGEGALSVSVTKRSAADFALWKKTKDAEKEPSWASPWGPGRPGWHIECSVMATEAFKTFGVTNIDIHAGGVDLKFPHHDNEIAQSEAYHSSHRWVNYWLHTGHLHIDGAKMSKSLKNFTSIRQALQSYSPRQLRLFFLLHKYNAPMDFSEEGLRQSIDIDKIFYEFYQNYKVHLRTLGHIGATKQHLDENNAKLFQFVTLTNQEIFNALADDFDTPKAVLLLRELIREYNKSIGSVPPNSPPGTLGLASVTISSVVKTVTSILRVFGMSQFFDAHDFVTTSNGEGGAENKEEILTPVLNEVINFRQSIRSAAKQVMKSTATEVAALKKESGGQILSLTDQVRNSFFKLGIRIEDDGEDHSIWKLVDLADVEKELKQKQQEEELKQKQKEAIAQKAAEKLAQSKIPPNELFVHLTGEYSEFDGDGIPTKDKEGNPLSEAKVKKLKKEHAAQAKLHQKYLETLQKEGDQK